MPAEPRDRRLVEAVGDVAHRLVDLQPAAVRRRDADALLAAMLQRVEAEVGQVGGLGVAVDAEDAALFLEGHSVPRTDAVAPIALTPPVRPASSPDPRSTALRPRPREQSIADCAVDRDRGSSRRRSCRSRAAGTPAARGRRQRPSAVVAGVDAHDDARRRLAEQRRGQHDRRRRRPRAAATSTSAPMPPVSKQHSASVDREAAFRAIVRRRESAPRPIRSTSSCCSARSRAEIERRRHAAQQPVHRLQDTRCRRARRGCRRAARCRARPSGNARVSTLRRVLDARRRRR